MNALMDAGCKRKNCLFFFFLFSKQTSHRLVASPVVQSGSPDEQLLTVQLTGLGETKSVLLAKDVI